VISTYVWAGVQSLLFCLLLLLQDNPNQSALLRCLSSLGMDTWAQVLLPKLTSQGSASDVALACSQLRDLCFGAVQHLDFSSVWDTNSEDISDVQDQLQHVAQHFKNTKAVQLLLDYQDSYHTLPYMLPALARWGFVGAGAAGVMRHTEISSCPLMAMQRSIQSKAGHTLVHLDTTCKPPSHMKLCKALSSPLSQAQAVLVPSLSHLIFRSLSSTPSL
jgi:uncharacterized protein with HEPN domain